MKDKFGKPAKLTLARVCVCRFQSGDRASTFRECSRYYLIRYHTQNGKTTTKTKHTRPLSIVTRYYSLPLCGTCWCCQATSSSSALQLIRQRVITAVGGAANIACGAAAGTVFNITELAWCERAGNGGSHHHFGLHLRMYLRALIYFFFAQFFFSLEK